MPQFHTKCRICRCCVILALACLVPFTAGCGRQEDYFAYTAETREDGADMRPESQAQDEDETGDAARLVVHICGAVRKPGVYELPKDSRVIDAVTAGGGFTQEADQSACNLAEPVADGSRIYILTKEESGQSAEMQSQIQSAVSAQAAQVQGQQDGKVDLNTAGAKELKTLPGIGDSKAAAILAWREEHGRFETTEDIMKVSGIKQAAYDKIKDKIKVSE